MNSFIKENAADLEAFSRMSQCAGARNDYVQGGGGNTSAKLAGGLMGIKASGYCLSDITPETAYAVLDYEALRRFYYGNESEQLADVEKQGSAFARENTKQIEGLPTLRPSVEAGVLPFDPAQICLPHAQRLRELRLLLDRLPRDRGKGVRWCGLQLGLGAVYGSRRKSDVRHPP